MITFVRMVVSGIFIILLTRLMGEKIKFSLLDLRNYSILGIFVIVMGGAFVTKGQETVASGTTAMLLALAPATMLLAEWYFNKVKPNTSQLLGITIGFVSIAWMQYYQGLNGQTSLVGFLFIVASVIGWIYGSHLSTLFRTNTGMSTLRSCGFMMLIGGIETMIFALIVGERFSDIQLGTGFVSSMSLQVLSTILGYTSYFWLLEKTRPMVAISYEFVNPVVALYLGWLLGNEIVGIPLVVACICLVSSAFLAVANKKTTH